MKGILFDFDGVIVDSPDYYFSHMKENLSSLGAPITDEDVAGLVGLTFSDKLKLVSEKYKVVIDKEKFLASIREKMDFDLNNSVALNKGLDVFLNSINTDKIKLGICSNNSIETINLILNKFSLADFFPEIISIEDVTKPKPDPESYLKAVNKLNLLPKDVVAFEDSVAGLKSAKSAGLKVVALPNKFCFRKDFEEADLLIDDFSSLKVSDLEGLF